MSNNHLLQKLKLSEYGVSMYIKGLYHFNSWGPPLVGESADMKLAHKMMSEVSVIVIVVAAIGIVTGLPVGLPYHEFLSIAYAAANFAIFTLGMGLLVLFILFPQVPVSFVVAAGAPPWDGELADVKPVQKRMFKVSFLAITIASIVIVADLPVNLPHHKLLSIVYTLAIFTTFAFGVVLLLLSILFPPLPISVVAAKKLIWVALGLVYLSFGLGMAIHAIS